MSELGLFEALRTTRAVRRLRPDPVPEPVLRRVLEAATWAPSGGNRQPWRIVLVRSPETKAALQRLYAVPWHAYSKTSRTALEQLPAPARSKAARNLAAADHLADHLHQAPVIAVFCFNPRLLAITDAKLARPSVVGGASIYPAVQNLLLACRAEGLGCTLTTLLCQAEAEVRPLLGLPEPWATAAFVPIGYPLGRGHAAPVTRHPVSQMVYAERFGEALEVRAMRELHDKVAVVTGAGSGIGRAIALELARAGMHVVLADIDPERLAGVQREIEALGRSAHGVVTDVRELAALSQLLSQTLERFGRCDVMVNNAGVFHANSMLGAPIEQWRRVIDTNLWGVIHGSHVFGKHFVQAGAGHIVNTASAAGLFPAVGMSSYSTSKFAIVGFSQQLRWELAAYGVGVTTLCPGVVNTGIGSAQGAGLAHLVDPLALTAKSPRPEGLARKVRRAIEHDQALVRYGSDAYLFSVLRLLPQWVIGPLGRFMARTAEKFFKGELKPKL